jgi:hypothetical protein
MRGDLNVTDGASAGAWIKPRLGGEFGAVTLQVPEGFEAYARIFHPASDSDGKPVRWAEVADTVGATVHREMQWHALLGLPGPEKLRGYYGPSAGVDSKWVGYDPSVGAMDLETLDALCEILATYTEDPGHCYFGLCTIQGWLDSFMADEPKPLFELPYGRDHIVLAGPLSAVDQIVRKESSGSSSQHVFGARKGGQPSPESPRDGRISREAPNLIWPADHTWMVTSEIDFDSTLVGGSAKLINAMVDLSALEAWKVKPTDSLAADADSINGAPDRGS